MVRLANDNSCGQGSAIRKAHSQWITDLESITGTPISGRSADARSAGGRPVALLIVLDRSVSMGGDEKLRKACAGAMELASDAIRKKHLVGVIGFGSEAEVLVNLTDSVGDVGRVLEVCTTAGSTNMTAALVLSLGVFKSKRGERWICVVTDGMPDDVDGALQAAELLKREGITIHVRGTDDADTAFLDRLKSPFASAEKVERRRLAHSISSLSRLLPPPPGW